MGKMVMDDFDVIIIGAGAAGMAAALSAAETQREQNRPLKIGVLEKAGPDGWGGNSRYTGANIRMDDEDHISTRFQDEIQAYSRGRSDPGHIEMLAKYAKETLGWLRSKGVRFESKPVRFNMRTQPRIAPIGGGLAIITALRKASEALGVMILFEKNAFKFIPIEEGAVNGILVRERDGMVRKVNSKAVILASGGFEGNPEMVTRYLGRDAVSLRMDVPATAMHYGEGITMALEIGAKPSGQFDGYHGQIADPRSRALRPLICCYPYGILVNNLGERFVDEGQSTVSESFETVSRLIFEQPDHIAYLILDQKFYSIEGYQTTIFTDQPPITGNTLEELAEKISLPNETLLKTIRDYNRAVQPGLFDPHREDGKHTEGINPKKSNWAVEIDTPRLLCYPAEGTLQFTWGGLATDTKARILDTNDNPIAGLYAAGEIAGLYYYSYPGGTSVLRALTFGRIAGREAVQYALSTQVRKEETVKSKL